MVKVLVLLLVCLLILGCATTKPAKKETTFKPLAGKDRLVAEDWFNSANHLYEYEQLTLAIQYYKKIINTYPETKYAHQAKRGLLRANKKVREKEAGPLIDLEDLEE